MNTFILGMAVLIMVLLFLYLIISIFPKPKDKLNKKDNEPTKDKSDDLETLLKKYSKYMLIGGGWFIYLFFVGILYSVYPEIYQKWRSGDASFYLTHVLVLMFIIPTWNKGTDFLKWVYCILLAMLLWGSFHDGIYARIPIREPFIGKSFIDKEGQQYTYGEGMTLFNKESKSVTVPKGSKIAYGFTPRGSGVVKKNGHVFTFMVAPRHRSTYVETYIVK